MTIEQLKEVIRTLETIKQGLDNKYAKHLIQSLLTELYSELGKKVLS